MRKTLITILVSIGLLAVAGGSTVAMAGYPDSVGVTKAHHLVRDAERGVAAAQARLRTAREVESQTRSAIAQYGVGVGRWVWLARDCGWPAGTIPNLMYIIERESGGSPKAYNPSGASGLLQEMPGWYAGDYYDFPDYDPFDPRMNLSYGYKGYQVSGWTPWAL